MYRQSRPLFIFLLVVLFFTAASPAQPVVFSNEKNVNILRGAITENYRCGHATEMVYIAESLQKLLDNKNFDCSELARLKVDFAKESLIAYEISGDCHVRAVAGVTRNDQARTYRVTVKTISGGCRAAGNYFGWLVIDKIPPGYTVDYVGVRAGNNDGELAEEELAFLKSLNSPQFQTLETRQIDLKDCIQLIQPHRRAIFSNDDFLRSIRDDAGRGPCLKDLEKIDFKKHSLLGIDINSGYCRIPLGLKHEAFRDDIKRQYLLSISYIQPGETCRHLSSYDLWVTVPKIPDGYDVKFDVKAVSREKTR